MANTYNVEMTDVSNTTGNNSVLKVVAQDELSASAVAGFICAGMIAAGMTKISGDYTDGLGDLTSQVSVVKVEKV